MERGCDMRSFGALDSSEENIAIIQVVATDGQTARRQDKQANSFFWNTWKRCTERTHVGDISIWNRTGAPPRKGFVVNGQTT